MTKRDYVISAIKHKNTDKVPYCIRLTGDACNLYGERLLRDFYSKDVSDDLKEGKLNIMQAVELSIGNFMADPAAPWWDWNHADTDPVYLNPDEEPQVMPEIYRYDTEERFNSFYLRAKYLAEKYNVIMYR
jgi:hypothetical protein